MRRSIEHRRSLQDLESKAREAVKSVAITQLDTRRVSIMATSLRVLYKMRISPGSAQDERAFRLPAGFVVYAAAREVREMHSIEGALALSSNASNLAVSFASVMHVLG